MKKTLMKDIAETLGISISQVSRALTHQKYVSNETRDRVLRLARKMKYRNLSSQHRKKIVVLADLFSDFESHILKQIFIESKRMKFSFYVTTSENLNHLNNQFFDGAVLISRNSEHIKWFEKFKMPLVIINQYGSPLENIASVWPDADHEVRAAMMHLIGLGHKKIARIHPEAKKLTKKELARGTEEFYRIAEENGIRGQVRSLCMEYSEDLLIQKVLQLADEGFTAFLAVIKAWTPHLLQAIRQTGRRVPEDISLITYEYDSSAYIDPPLTTIAYDYEQLVRIAIEQLKKEIAGKEIVPMIQIPCKFNIRSSTAAPPRNRKK